MKQGFVFLTILFALFSCAVLKAGNAWDSWNGDGISHDSVDYAIKVFWKRTSCRDIPTKRLKAMDILQRCADACSDTLFREYLKSDEKEARMLESKYGILYYYKAAFDKINKEIASTRVKNGTITIWLLYNMGYVVKTPTQCFAIDICHKYGHLLADKIDFLLITHHHSDHYTKELIEAMNRLNKPVISNFVDNQYNIDSKKDLHFGDISIHTALADHNLKHLNFVVTYEVDCGASTNHFTLMHIGDTYNASQLKPQGKIDLLIPHLAVGLDMQKAFENVQPHEVFLSHLLELGHSVNLWRWPYVYGELQRANLKWPNVWIPVWGEKIIMKNH